MEYGHNICKVYKGLVIIYYNVHTKLTCYKSITSYVKIIRLVIRLVSIFHEIPEL